MKFHCPHFRTGVGLTVLLAVCGLLLGSLPGLVRLGPLTIALILGLLWRGLMHVPAEHHAGIGFSARQLLRMGIILLGVRLDFALIAHSGGRIIALDFIVIVFGLAFITWLGRRAGLDGPLPLLIAVGSSICGASAVAAAAPVIRARDSDIALAIPLCSLFGTVAALALTLGQAFLHLAPDNFGILAGSTLHEVAQVIAASSSVPGALESGTIVKLVRVLLLVPVVLVLGQWFQQKDGTAAPIQKPWFVGGFFLVGVINTALVYAFPSQRELWTHLDHQLLTVANFLMAMAMAGLGLQVDATVLRTQGIAALKVATLGWVALLLVAAGAMYLFRL